MAADARRTLEESDARFAAELQAVPERVWRKRGDLIAARRPPIEALRALREASDAFEEGARSRKRDLHAAQLQERAEEQRKAARAGEGPHSGAAAPRLGRAAGGGKGKGKAKEVPMTCCPICIEDVPTAECVTPLNDGDAVGGSSSHMQLMGPCGHSVCQGCATQYALSIIKADRKTRLPCPQPGCGAAFDDVTVATLLEGEVDALALYRQLQATAALGARLMYCPLPRCAHPLEMMSKEDPCYPMAICPSCTGSICVACRSPWHEGLTCQQFGRLPQELRGAEDAAVLKLAGERGWRPCPRCRSLIERNEDGCNFVACRCGALAVLAGCSEKLLWLLCLALTHKLSFFRLWLLLQLRSGVP